MSRGNKHDVCCPGSRGCWSGVDDSLDALRTKPLFTVGARTRRGGCAGTGKSSDVDDCSSQVGACLTASGNLSMNGGSTLNVCVVHAGGMVDVPVEVYGENVAVLDDDGSMSLGAGGTACCCLESLEEVPLVTAGQRLL